MTPAPNFIAPTPQTQLTWSARRRITKVCHAIERPARALSPPRPTARTRPARTRPRGEQQPVIGARSLDGREQVGSMRKVVELEVCRAVGGFAELVDDRGDLLGCGRHADLAEGGGELLVAQEPALLHVDA